MPYGHRKNNTLLSANRGGFRPECLSLAYLSVEILTEMKILLIIVHMVGLHQRGEQANRIEGKVFFFRSLNKIKNSGGSALCS